MPRDRYVTGVEHPCPVHSLRRMPDGPETAAIQPGYSNHIRGTTIGASAGSESPRLPLKSAGSSGASTSCSQATDNQGTNANYSRSDRRSPDGAVDPPLTVMEWLINIGLSKYERNMLDNGFDRTEFMVSFLCSDKVIYRFCSVIFYQL